MQNVWRWIIYDFPFAEYFSKWLVHCHNMPEQLTISNLDGEKSFARVIYQAFGWQSWCIRLRAKSMFFENKGFIFTDVHLTLYSRVSNSFRVPKGHESNSWVGKTIHLQSHCFSTTVVLRWMDVRLGREIILNSFLHVLTITRIIILHKT